MESPRNNTGLPDPRIDAARFRIELIRNMLRLLADAPPAASRQNRNDRDDRNQSGPTTNPADKRAW